MKLLCAQPHEMTQAAADLNEAKKTMLQAMGDRDRDDPPPPDPHLTPINQEGAA